MESAAQQTHTHQGGWQPPQPEWPTPGLRPAAAKPAAAAAAQGGGSGPPKAPVRDPTTPHAEEPGKAGMPAPEALDALQGRPGSWGVGKPLGLQGALQEGQQGHAQGRWPETPVGLQRLPGDQGSEATAHHNHQQCGAAQLTLPQQLGVHTLVGVAVALAPPPGQPASSMRQPQPAAHTPSGPGLVGGDVREVMAHQASAQRRFLATALSSQPAPFQPPPPPWEGGVGPAAASDQSVRPTSAGSSNGVRGKGPGAAAAAPSAPPGVAAALGGGAGQEGCGPCEAWGPVSSGWGSGGRRGRAAAPTASLAEPHSPATPGGRSRRQGSGEGGGAGDSPGWHLLGPAARGRLARGLGSGMQPAGPWASGGPGATEGGRSNKGGVLSARLKAVQLRLAANQEGLADAGVMCTADCQAELSTGPCSLELCSAVAEQTQQPVAVKDVEVAVDQARSQPPPDSTPVPLPPPQAVLSKAAPAESAGSKASGFSPVAKTALKAAPRAVALPATRRGSYQSLKRQDGKERVQAVLFSTSKPTHWERYGTVMVLYCGADGSAAHDSELQQMLLAEGYDTRVVHNQPAAMQALTTAEALPDMVVIDADQSFNTLRLIEQVNSMNVTVATLVMGSVTTRPDAITSLTAGAADHMCKPVDLEELVARIGRHVQRQHSIKNSRPQHQPDAASKGPECSPQAAAPPAGQPQQRPSSATQSVKLSAVMETDFEEQMEELSRENQRLLTEMSELRLELLAMRGATSRGASLDCCTA
ncbi:hypothetical protein QJQ45_001104 [Haematococcus lacustris]|nr:hypothetical protein QJQ45_001104 [Haematococcus lacustris]